MPEGFKIKKVTKSSLKGSALGIALKSILTEILASENFGGEVGMKRRMREEDTFSVLKFIKVSLAPGIGSRMLQENGNYFAQEEIVLYINHSGKYIEINFNPFNASP